VSRGDALSPSDCAVVHGAIAAQQAHGIDLIVAQAATVPHLAPEASTEILGESMGPQAAGPVGEGASESTAKVQHPTRIPVHDLLGTHRPLA
jgi:hypothetical protein